MIYKTLHKIIDEEVIIPVNMDKKNIIVKETDQKAKLKRIIISGFTDDEFKKVCVLFKLKRISKKGVYRPPQKKTLNSFTRVPLFIEDNCERKDNFIDLKKYTR